jgi:predicted P-loop ATPase
VVDSLNSLKWDGKKRLDLMLFDYFNADIEKDAPHYLSAIGRAWMIGTVARAFDPGCKHDHVLTLEGGQGYGKSKALRILASAIAPQAYREGLPPLTLGQEAVRSLSGAWIVELAELAFMDKTTTEHIKAFLTKESDSYRVPFGRREITTPRTVSFAATTNQSEFVRDTAARRYWVFKVAKPIDIPALEAVAPQLWAEAVAAYKAGERWWLTDASVLKYAESSQSERLERNGFEEEIAEKIIDKITVAEVSTYRVQTKHIFSTVTGSTDLLDLSKSGKAFADALTRSGFVKTKSNGRSYWSVGESLEAAIRKASS